jgi:hypothetical protein
LDSGADDPQAFAAFWQSQDSFAILFDEAVTVQ